MGRPGQAGASTGRGKDRPGQGQGKDGAGGRAMGPGAMQKIMAAGVTAMAALALAFWLAAFLGDGPRAVIAALPATAVVLFTLGHLPAMAGAILLWRAGIGRGRPPLRWGLGIAMVYFSAACIIAVCLNFFAAAVLDLII